MPAYPSETRIFRGIVGVGRLAFQYTAGLEKLFECRVVLRIVDLLRLLLGIEMVKVAVEFIEAVNGGKKLITVAEMVLPNLGRYVALGLSSSASVGSSG